MKLTKAQAHIANEIRRHHDQVTDRLERLTRATADANYALALGPDHSGMHTSAIISITHELGAAVAARTALIDIARAAGIEHEFVAKIIGGPLQYYMANDDEAERAGEDPDEDLDEVDLMRQRHTFKCILAGRKAFDENRRDYIASDGQKAAEQWMPVIKRDLIVAEWLNDGTKSCECAR